MSLIWGGRYTQQKVKMRKKNVKLKNSTHKVFIKKSVHFHVCSLSSPEDIQPEVQFQQNARTSVIQHLVGRYQWVVNAAFEVLRKFATCPGKCLPSQKSQQRKMVI
ncbi:hypothetical protein AVEN_225259-1 [Araneus ventricosus]|uniref:Uncharacterized protein n=1 Tax=Araneus ventricosus TaxID=182803 RepID=A0A4Y2ALE1_ARAVE|nr:hypothetical protein AVEN_225259-1 [Araneus ventricosus]